MGGDLLQDGTWSIDALFCYILIQIIICSRRVQTDNVEFDKVYIMCQFQGNMDIDEGDYSEESDQETQMKKMEVLVYKLFTRPTFTHYVMEFAFCYLFITFNSLSILFSVLKVDAASNAQECDLKNIENDSFSDSNSSDVIERPHMVTNVRSWTLCI